ncbi:hypothetical protein B0H34DRAFT_861044 [Crassisporium funariophilum]|nr:hypothetical protein B0H34DRAFT_861044 [Crassisporium funariophilum]
MSSAVVPQELQDHIIDTLAAQGTVRSRRALKSCSLVSHSFRHRATRHIFRRIRTDNYSDDGSLHHSRMLQARILQYRELRDTIQNNPHLRSCMRVLQVETAIGKVGDERDKLWLPSAMYEVLDIMRLQGQINGSKDGIQKLEVLGKHWRKKSNEKLQSSILKFVMEGGPCRGAQRGPLQRIRFGHMNHLSPLLLTRCAGSVTEMTLHSSRFLGHPRDFTTPSIRLKKLSIDYSLCNFIETLVEQCATVVLSELESLTFHPRRMGFKETWALGKLLSLTAKTLRTLEIRQTFIAVSPLSCCRDLGSLPRLTLLRLCFDNEIPTLATDHTLQLLDPSLHSPISIQAVEIAVSHVVSWHKMSYIICHHRHQWHKLVEDLTSPRCHLLRTVNIVIRVGLAYVVEDQEEELARVRRDHYLFFRTTFAQLSALVTLNIVVEVYSKPKLWT